MKTSLIEAIKDHYRLPYSLGVSGGVDNVLLGVYAILTPDKDPTNIRQSILATLNPSKLGIAPSISIDPIGHLFGSVPVCNLEFCKKQLILHDRSEWNLLLSDFLWNKYHIALCENALQYVVETCRQHHILGVVDFRKDAALVHRFRQQMLHVMLSPVDLIPRINNQNRDDVNQILQQAKNQLRIVRPGFQIHQNAFTSVIHRKTRKEAEIDLLSIRLGLTFTPQQRITVIHHAQSEELEDAQSVFDAQINDKIERRSFAELCSKKRRMQEDLTSIAPPRGVGEVQFRKILSESLARVDDSDAACLIALIGTTFLSVDDLSFVKIVNNGECRYLATPRPHITLTDPSDTNLHMPVEPEYCRRIPSQLISAAERILPCKIPEKLQEEVSLWLHQRGCSLSGYIYALRFNSPCWNQHSWVPSEFGLNKIRLDKDGKPKMHGYMHYLVYSPEEFEPEILKYFEFLGLSTLPDPEINKIPFCGSKNCVSPHIAGEMLNKLLELISVTDVYHSSDYIFLASHCNAISGLVRLFEFFLTFRRNYPGFSPLFSQKKLLYQSGMIREKVRPRRYIIAPNLTALLEHSAAAFRRTVKRLEEIGYSVVSEDGKPVDCFGYGFLPLTPNNRNLVILGSSKSRIVHGLAHHPLTEKFSGISGNAFRNLSYFLLSSDPRLSLSVKALHDHASGGGGSSRNHAGIGIHSDIVEKAESHILRKLGFEKGLFL